MNFSFNEALSRGWVTESDRPKVAKATVKTRSKGKKELEGDEQAELVALFRLKHPSVGRLLVHIPNGGSRKNAFEGWRMKVQGVRAGVSDLLLPVARGGYFGLWIEFKALPPNDAKVSTEQQIWLGEMQEQGYFAEVCRGVTATLEVLDRYLCLPPTAQLLELPHAGATP